MAKQDGHLPIKGTINGLSYYYDKNHGYLIRRKGGPTKEQFKQKDSMELPRQNSREFGRASKYSALLRGAFGPVIKHCREYSMSRRLQRLLLSILKNDPSSKFGERQLLSDNLVYLQDFELNERCSFTYFFKGELSLDVCRKGLIAKASVRIPPSVFKRASHYRLISLAANVDFIQMKKNTSCITGDILPCMKKFDIKLEHSITFKNHVFYGLSICFFEEQNGRFAAIDEDGFKAGFITYISK